jgi:hypothetical protein
LPLLGLLQGFQYCDLLLGEAERAAWWQLMAGPERTSRVEPDMAQGPPRGAGAQQSIPDDASDDSE